MHLLILTDGKKGHENQSLGLAEAMLRRQNGSYEVSHLSDSLVGTSDGKKPHAIIAAGHATHPFLLRLARRYHCPSVVIMKPSLPAFLFSHCLVPEHDLKPKRKLPKNSIPTKGALNRIPEEIPPKEDKGLLMLGGPSKLFTWENEPVINAIETIVQSQPQLTWTVGDSRRTPANVLAQLSAKNLPLTLAPHQENGGSWLADQLLTSQTAWITPDSTSMLFEALTARCRLGTLPLKANDTRLSRAHDQLAADHYLTPFISHDPRLGLPAPPTTLHETARCAEILLDKISIR